MSNHEEPRADQAELNDFGKLAYQFLKYGQNASNNVADAFGEMTAQQWLRMVAIVGAYMLIRPYVTIYLGKRQVESMDKQDKAEKQKAKISPNQLRGEKAGPYEEDEDDEEGAEATGTSGWGAKARTRQRVMLKKMLEAEEKRRQEEEDDKDIADLLED